MLSLKIKKKYIHIFICFFVLLLNKAVLTKEIKSFTKNYEVFYSIPILNDGRIKPLLSFAQTFSYEIYGEKKNYHESIIWLMDVLFDKNKIYNQKIFKINNKDLLINLGLSVNKNFLYSLNELTNAIEKRFDLIKLLNSSTQQNLTKSQKELLSIYFKIAFILEINSITLFIIPDIYLNFKLHISQYDLLKYLKLRDKSNELKININKKFSVKHDHIYLIPFNDVIWFSLNEAFLNNSTNSLNFLNLFNSIAKNYSEKKNETFIFLCKELKILLLKVLSSKKIFKIYLENYYNKVMLLNINILLYFLVFLFSMVSFIKKFNKKIFNKLIIFTFLSSFVIHILLVIIRIFITSRPPVTSLYESVIFVNLIFVLIILLLFYSIRLRFITLYISICSLIACLLQYIAYKIGSDCDSFKNLMSVLNTNFWLITHVITISLGYSLCLIVGFLGHVYLYFYVINFQKTEYLNKLSNILLILCLLALFFSLSGTILGGIWADQSWGRFWGWDPKENGALLIVLWLILILHFRLVRFFSPFFFAISTILNNLVVFVTWFGVNLLNIGLHTYGFIQNIWEFLLIFCCLEFLYILIFTFIHLLKKHFF